MDKEKLKKELHVNGFLYWVYKSAADFLCHTKLHVKFDRTEFKNRDKNKGILLIYDHQCIYDHFVIASFFGQKNKVNHVVTNRQCFNHTLRKFFKIVKSIPRDQFKNDTVSIRQMKRVLDNKGIVSLAPSGQISIDGSLPYIHPAIVKLIKLFKVDVWAFKAEGTYLAMPKWGTASRHYPINATCTKVLDGDKVKKMDDDEIYRIVTSSIDAHDVERNHEKHQEIKGKNLAKGLEKFLIYCPKCMHKYTLSTDGNEIVCSHCGNKITYNHYGELVGNGNDYVLPKDESVWYDLQENFLRNELLAGDYKLSSKVTLWRNNHDPLELESVGTGVLTYNVDKIIYTGTCDDKPYTKEFNLAMVYQLPFAPATRFNIPDEEGVFEFVPDNKLEIIEWVMLVDVINKIKEEKRKKKEALEAKEKEENNAN